MASVLKRKRAFLEVEESSKRSRYTKENQEFAPELDLTKVGWDAAFGPKQRRRGPINGNNGEEAVLSVRASDSPEAEDFQDLLDRARAEEREEREIEAVSKGPNWKISDPIGGRIIGIDPVFTEEEKYIIVAHRNALEIYSTSNSLLNRSIKLSLDAPRKFSVRIVDFVLSPTDPNIIWVACSDGSIYRVDWTSGEGWEKSWKTPSKGIHHMAVASMELAKQKCDMLFTTDKNDTEWHISAHELSTWGTKTTTQSRVIYKTNQMIQLIKAADAGAVIVAASEERVLLGALRSAGFGSIDRIRYEFRVFRSIDFISSLDVRISDRGTVSEAKTSKLDRLQVVDVVVGDAKGAIFLHNDLLRNLIASEKSAANVQHPINLIPRKLHWHRKAVQSVKWSLDGSYIISGGSETVLVLWQLDTGKQQYLPHLSAAIQNIVVSPRGTSYAVHLGDNSTMILSTTELVPTANIAGIQVHVLGSSAYDSRVRRLQDEVDEQPFVLRSLAVINPAHPENLLVAVSEAQEINTRSSIPGAPYLQTFGIASNHNVSRQAMTRTNATNKNIAPNAHPISEPLISHMQISQDGIWLATVDEWLPPKHDVEFLGHSGTSLEGERRRRREVYLKFWNWSKTNENWALVTRMDAPHTMAVEKCGAGRVLALAADSSSHTFSTLGEDGIVLIWRPRIRKRDGVIVRGLDGEPLCTWSCHRRVSLGTAIMDDDSTFHGQQIPSHASLSFSDDGSLLAAAINGYGYGLVHFVDPANGTIQSSRSLMYCGDLISMAFLAQYLIILSSELRIYDLVLDEAKYGITLGKPKDLLSLEQKAQMMHLAVDHTNQTFAIALPFRDNWSSPKSLSARWFSKSYSELAVFDPRYPTPIYIHTHNSLITALLPAVSSPGYVLLDTMAEIRTISPKAVQTLTSIARPVVELRLDIYPSEGPEQEGDMALMQLAEDPDIDAEEEEGIASQLLDNDTAAAGQQLGLNKNNEDEDDNLPVITSHQLSSVLDIGPSFALPPIEELFYAVAGLVCGKPRPQRTEEQAGAS